MISVKCLYQVCSKLTQRQSVPFWIVNMRRETKAIQEMYVILLMQEILAIETTEAIFAPVIPYTTA